MDLFSYSGEKAGIMQKQHFLYLEVGRSETEAAVVCGNGRKSRICDRIRIRYNDLDLGDDKNRENMFMAALDRIKTLVSLKNCTHALIFLSCAFVSFRTITLPFRSRRKAEQILPMELAGILPCHDEAHVSDFYFLDVQDESNWIFTASAAASLIGKYFDALSCFHMRPSVIAPVIHAAVTGFLRQHASTASFVFIHIWKNETSMAVVIKRRTCAVRTLPDPCSSPEASARAFKQALMDFCHRTCTDPGFDIVICSDTDRAETRKIETLFRQDAGRWTNPGPFASQAHDIRHILPYGSARAYALNLCKGKFQPVSFFRTYSAHLGACIVFIILALSLALADISLDNAILAKKIAAVDAEAVNILRTSFPGIKTIIDPYLQMQANVKKLDAQNSGTRAGNTLSSMDRASVISIMAEISKKIDSSTDIEVTGFLLSGTRLILSGSTGSFNTVDTIKTSLASSLLLKNVSISSAAVDRKSGRVRFKFLIEI